ncbi:MULTISPECIES: hypothetical protein [Streptomyces]|uniref:hypothetical protein n=1 Tax=Streptomyces TaxID=1883 RepID=UPI002256BAE4|nr:hypothetical protein [Streptomyces sp. NBC_00268]MCX5188870.1 hypothetical protein [Streptomyces sp. NBC_00268]
MLLSHEQLRAPAHDNLCTLLAALKHGGVPTSMDAPRAAGRLKAEQGIPLAALLHAFRLGGRFIWDRLLAMALGKDSAAWLLHRASDIWLIGRQRRGPGCPVRAGRPAEARGPGRPDSGESPLD